MGNPHLKVPTKKGLGSFVKKDLSQLVGESEPQSLGVQRKM